jgi:hypothetical protein
MLRPIGFQSLDETLPVLSRGFCDIPAAFWRAAIERLKRHGAADPTATAGYLLESKNRAVGAILSIPSLHGGADGRTERVVNLSSWYIDPQDRWRAPRMLQRITGCDRTLYTDLTPTPSVQTLIGRMGFRHWMEGTLILALPLRAIGRSGHSQIIPLHDLSSDALPAATRRLLEDHAALDCIAAALWDGTVLHPLIFSRSNRRGLRVTRLIYAQDQAVLTSNMTTIARFLLRQGFMLLAVKADRDERIPGSVFMRQPPSFYKGEHPPSRCDLSYSEYVFLQI